MISSLQAACVNAATIELPIIRAEKEELLSNSTSINKVKSSSQLDVLKDGTNKAIGNSSLSIKNFPIKTDLESNLAKAHINDLVFDVIQEKKYIRDENLNASANLLQSSSSTLQFTDNSTYRAYSNNYKGYCIRSSTNNMNNSIKSDSFAHHDNLPSKSTRSQFPIVFDKTESVNNLCSQQYKQSLLESVNHCSQSLFESEKCSQSYCFMPYNRQKEFKRPIEEKKDNNVCKSNFVEVSEMPAILYNTDTPVLQALNLRTDVTKFQTKSGPSIITSKLSNTNVIDRTLLSGISCLSTSMTTEPLSDALNKENLKNNFKFRDKNKKFAAYDDKAEHLTLDCSLVQEFNNVFTTESTLTENKTSLCKKKNLNSLRYQRAPLSSVPTKSMTAFSSTKVLIPDRPPLISQKSTSCIPSSSQLVSRYGFNRASEGNQTYSCLVRAESRHLHYPTVSLQKRINAYCAAANIPKSIGCSSTRSTRVEGQAQKSDIVSSLPSNRKFFSIDKKF